MKNISEIVLSILLVVIPLGVVYFVVSYAINKYFGAEFYAIIIVGLALFFIVQDILKKIKKKKNE